MSQKESQDDDLTVLRAPSRPGTFMPSVTATEQPGLTVEGGAVLKQRFVLETPLGSGGMGTVYKARDLRKVEAQDRHPFVAIKLLNADFKQHPEAFIALEREASKSQGLAHPNIVSIFDFDKDGDAPYIVMELLEGQELSELLRQFPDGLPEAMAWPIIRGLIAGLRHAHEAGVVHADFKPGNVFVLTDQAVKILDFGIARAVRFNSDGSAANEDTVFDPQRLAALTPAYASREMLNGDSAAPRDDLYSLGIVIYLILTGHHPYGRLSAKDAAREQLRPDRPRRLSLRQWRALDQCLRFNRSDRPTSIELVERAFFEPPAWRSKTAIAAALGIALTLAVTTLREDVELELVKAEARQTALQDVHLERLRQLAGEPANAAGWFDQIAAELSALEAFPEARAEQTAARQLLARRIEVTAASLTLPEALSLLDSARGLLPTGVLEDSLTERLAEALRTTLAQAAPTALWWSELEARIQVARSALPQRARWAELELEVVDALIEAGHAALAAADYGLAGQLIEVLEQRSFLREPVAALKDALLSARAAAAEVEAARLERALNQRYDSSVAALLEDGCVSLKPSELRQALDRLDQELSVSAGRGRAAVDARLADCAQTLAVSDPDLAFTLREDGLRAFADYGSLTALAAVDLDPCAPAFLIGNGALGGRRGSCLDRFADGTAAPRLVVVPGAASGPFAMQQQEVSEADFARFCEATDACTQSPSELPVRGVSFALAQRYARWLAVQTGRRYRLPTLVEWNLAVGDELPADRNCLLQRGAMLRGGAPVPVAAAQAGAFGLLHAAGNVREWVLAPKTGAALAVGGSFNDPVATCGPESRAEPALEGDAQTGLRLLRELG